MNIRRYYVPNSIVFITQVVAWRNPFFQEERFVDLWRTVLREVKVHHPFAMLAYVVMFDHFHLLIRPTGQSNFSDIMQSLKRNYTIEYKKLIGVNGRMKFWQKGFWDHVIRDEIDFERHLHYIHYNPVRHQLVNKPEAWSHSSYANWQQQGSYEYQWGWTLPETIADYDWTDSEKDNE